MARFAYFLQSYVPELAHFVWVEKRITTRSGQLRTLTSLGESSLVYTAFLSPKCIPCDGLFSTCISGDTPAIRLTGLMWRLWNRAIAPLTEGMNNGHHLWSF